MAAQFVDHYAVLGATPETPQAELKKLYHEKLREYHPDKRPESTGGTGAKVTQELYAAWEVLQDPDKRAAYDEVWRAGRLGALSPSQRADICRREGNELYKEAQAIVKSQGPESLSGAANSLHRYQAAIAKYSDGIQLAPQDHRLYSNRALCYAAVKDWNRCREDAVHVTQLKRDFFKGWFLMAKAIWKLGQPVEAERKLEEGLALVPGNTELLTLQAELAPDLKAYQQSGHEYLPRVGSNHLHVSRNVSPACTPTRGNSRVATPPPCRGASRSPGPAGAEKPPPAPHSARGRHNSRSPGPAQRRGSRDFADYADQTAQFGEQTAGFGGRSHAEGRSYRTSCSPSPRRDATPPRPRDPTPPRGPDGPRQKMASLSGMVAASRVGLHGQS